MQCAFICIRWRCSSILFCLFYVNRTVKQFSTYSLLNNGVGCMKQRKSNASCCGDSSTNPSVWKDDGFRTAAKQSGSATECAEIFSEKKYLLKPLL